MTALVILVALLAIGVMFLTGFLVMAHRENQQLQEDLSATVSFREYAGPYVPDQWKPTEEHLDDPNVRRQSTPEGED